MTNYKVVYVANNGKLAEEYFAHLDLANEFADRVDGLVLICK